MAIRIPELRPNEVSLVLNIRDQSYAVTPVAPKSLLAIGVQAYDLVKSDGEVYNVACGPTGFNCTCPDHEFRSGPEERACKHILACHYSGLITIRANRRDADIARHL